VLIYETFLKLSFFLLSLAGKLSTNQKFLRFVFLRSSVHQAETLAALQKWNDDIRPHKPQAQVCWVHVASAGELEQIIPVMRMLHEKFCYHFFVTYFSPSAEPFLKNVPGLVAACGFPVDTRANHQKILNLLKPQHIFFVRYDIWPALLRRGKHCQIPIHLLAARRSSTRKGVLKILGNSWKQKMFPYFSNIFAVSEDDALYFRTLRMPLKVFVAGDAKWSRAKERAQSLKEVGIKEKIGVLGEFTHAQKMGLEKKCFVFGSPHAEEHQLALQSISLEPKPFIVYVPHEVTPSTIAQILQDATAKGALAVTLSALEQEIADLPAQQNSENTPAPHAETHQGNGVSNREGRTLPSTHLKSRVEIALPLALLAKYDFVVVDRIGMLAELYALADVAIVGGGFDGHIHNTLEAAAHPVVTVFGSNCEKAFEATMLIREKAGFSFPTPQELFQFLGRCVRVKGRTPSEGPFAQSLAETRLRAMELFLEVPNTSEVVSAALQQGKNGNAG
jgi:3-deoxy-D-manno-octulosonic-acid transferase